MLNITDSDIFKLQNHTNVFTNKISEILRRAKAGSMGTDIVILNNILDDALRRVRKMYNEPLILKAIDDIEKGRIILVELSMELNIPKCMPFIRYKANDGQKILVNLTSYLEKSKDSMGNPVYNIAVQKFYPIIICSYLANTVFTENYVLPAKALHNSAYIWASMFNKVLNRAIALGTNREKYDAFMYFAMKFFCLYYMHSPETVAEDVARSYLAKQGRKNFPLVDEIQLRLNERSYNIYTSLQNFCTGLFDNSITNLRGVISDSSTKQINFSFFLNRFVDTYTYTALFALGAFPYFLFSVINATMKTRVVNDLAFQDFITDKDYNALALMNAIY